ncbi:DNA repair protein rhp54 [Hordeum vulgare]|nr:DNA repair protein rhp54 [Hordeum vulgare]
MRKCRRHAQEARIDVAVASTLLAVAEQEVEAMRHALVMLGLNPGQHRLVAAAVVATSTSLSPLRHRLPDSPHMSTTPHAHDFHPHHPQASHLSISSGSGSPVVSVVAPSTLAPTSIDLNATPWAADRPLGGSAWKRQHELSADTMENTRNLFDPMSVAHDEANRMFMESIIFEGGAGGGGIPFDPDETLFPGRAQVPRRLRPRRRR